MFDNIEDFEAYIREQARKEEEYRRTEMSKYKYDSIFEKFLLRNNVTEDTVTNEMLDWYALHVYDKKGYYDTSNGNTYNPNINVYINEVLQKTSLELLKKQLNRDLNTGKGRFVNYRKDNDDHTNTLYVSKEIYDRDRIFKTCDKMMWVFTAVYVGNDIWMNPMKVDEPYVCDDWGIDLVKIRVEPIKTKNITDFVNNECKGKIYHLCKKDDVDRILKSGLRGKGEKNDYRYINRRVFFVCGETKDDIIENLDIVFNSKIKDTELTIEDFSLIEIDVNGYNIDFYQDDYYLEDVKYIGYSYNYFPPSRLKEVDIKEYEKHIII